MLDTCTISKTCTNDNAKIERKKEYRLTSLKDGRAVVTSHMVLELRSADLTIGLPVVYNEKKTVSSTTRLGN